MKNILNKNIKDICVCSNHYVFLQVDPHAIIVSPFQRRTSLFEPLERPPPCNENRVL